MTLGSRLSGRRTTSLTAAVLVTAAAGLVGALGVSAPARAADCASSGVTVIADFNQLGGGVQGDCVPEGGGKTAQVLFEAKFQLSYARSQQTPFVCAVSGLPGSGACPGNDYWSLWVSDGESGSPWVYATSGVGDLTVPQGGLVALSWDEVSGYARPSASSERSTPSPTASPTPTPTPSPSQSPIPSEPGPASDGGDGESGGRGGDDGGVPSEERSAGGGPSATDEASDVPLVDPTQDPTDEPTNGATDRKRKSRSEPAESPTAGVSESPWVEETAVTQPEMDEIAPAVEATGADSGLPGFVAPALIVLLFGGAGVAWWVRRRSPLDS